MAKYYSYIIQLYLIPNLIQSMKDKVILVQLNCSYYNFYNSERGKNKVFEQTTRSYSEMSGI